MRRPLPPLLVQAPVQTAVQTAVQTPVHAGMRLPRTLAVRIGIALFQRS
jgi:hypothetical protein